MDKPQLAEVKTLFQSNHRQVTETLRALADEIDAGRYGKVSELAVVLMSVGGLEVFAMGDADVGSAHLMLCAGARKLESPILAYGVTN